MGNSTVGPTGNLPPAGVFNGVPGVLVPIPPIGRLMGFDNTPIQAPFTGPFDRTINILDKLGVTVAADYSLAIAEQKAPSHSVNHLA